MATYNKYKYRELITAIQYTGNNLSELSNSFGHIFEFSEYSKIIHTTSGQEIKPGDYVIRTKYMNNNAVTVYDVNAFNVNFEPATEPASYTIATNIIMTALIVISALFVTKPSVSDCIYKAAQHQGTLGKLANVADLARYAYQVDDYIIARKVTNTITGQVIGWGVGGTFITNY